MNLRKPVGMVTDSVGIETKRLNLRKLVGMVRVSAGMETKRLEFEKACRDGGSWCWD